MLYSTTDIVVIVILLLIVIAWIATYIAVCIMLSKCTNRELEYLEKHVHFGVLFCIEPRED